MSTKQLQVATASGSNQMLLRRPGESCGTDLRQQIASGPFYLFFFAFVRFMCILRYAISFGEVVYFCSLKVLLMLKSNSNSVAG
jgi:hypothetical protein